MIGITIEDDIAVIGLARPPVNALDRDMKRRLDALLRELDGQEAVRAVVLRSELPGTFCAGSDLHELAREHALPGAAGERTALELALWQRLAGLPQVTIAAIDGHALGSGLELAIACDLRVAGEGARLGLPEVTIGGAPGIQALTRLPLLVGLGRARRMLLSGERLEAREAWSAGLVDEVAPAGAAFEAARALARRMADRPRASVAFLKASLDAVADASLERVAQVAEQGVEALFTAPGMREGIAAFREKRTPDFRAAEARARGAGP